MTIRMKPLAAMLAAAGIATSAQAQVMESVTVNGGPPSSLPTQIPTTIESITRMQIEERVNALDSEDALKYFPSLNVRKRYVGDYDHAVLASRASGTGNSARSLVYADGIQLSNLLGNGATFTPRWGLVTPEEIERVDVLYGPFSASYPGNSVGAVVDYQTRMPNKLEAHLKLSGFAQHFTEYGSDDNYYGKHASASLGDRQGAFAWWFNLSRLDSRGQPLAFANKFVSAGVPGSGGVPVTGAIASRNPSNRDWLILGSTNQIHTEQDHAKLKLAYDLSSTLRASYTLGWWQNGAQRSVESYLRDASGRPVTLGDINVNGRRYTLTGSDFAPQLGELEHLMHGLSLKSSTKGLFDWEVAASLYDYARDVARTPSNITDMEGSGWNTLALKGVWRPGRHNVDFGIQRDAAKLRTRVFGAADWVNAEEGRFISSFRGETRLESAYAQDSWRMDEAWRLTLGARFERWQALGGALSGVGLPSRSETSWSPKAALSWRSSGEWTLKASAGRAVRNPTAAELFQGSIVDGKPLNTDPNLRAEKSWTTELTAERMTERGSLRTTFFHERTRDALYSQALTPTVNTVQNVGRIRTNGLEVSQQEDRLWWPQLSLNSSLTYADSRILRNDAFPASVGKQQPRVPRWRATLLTTWRENERWSATLGLRYSGRQFGTLDNSDPNGFAYMGVSQFLVADLRMRYRIGPQWTMSAGVDNLNNKKYWAFHPYTQRTLVAELRYDL
ncbi:TonB-dependent receptor [Massilia endophytica]|uniref:TonB-dependent receptor n=1 Tax=Massilia endophytica TaxID=2899220 RepID=UPI001E608AA0|nr:TonB-dependent receptor [Massilia endophytica]UGQ47902.1 TonB-dependent receptor [Massilia endophytica]